METRFENTVNFVTKEHEFLQRIPFCPLCRSCYPIKFLLGEIQLPVLYVGHRYIQNMKAATNSTDYRPSSEVDEFG